jgi:hypothetical protein
MKHVKCLLGMLAGVGLIGCQTADAPWKAAPKVEKLGTEQTDGPGAEARHPQEKEDVAVRDRPQPEVHFQPLDLTSDTGDTPLRVEIETFGVPFAKSAIDDVVGQVGLATYPEMQPVSFDTKVVDETGDSYGPNGGERRKRIFIDVTPQGRLADRWYSLTLARIPTTVKMPKHSMHHAIAGGGVGARFSRGSDPTISSVRVCQKEGGRQAVLVDFSERISTEPVVLGQLRLMGASNCKLENSGASSTETVAYTCAQLGGAQDVTVEADGLRAARSGKLTGSRGLTAATASKVSFRWETLGAWDEGCRIQRQ